MSTSRNKGAPPDATTPANTDARASDRARDPANIPDRDAVVSGTGDLRDGGNAGSRPADYEVGYRRPPRQHRFKPGQSGNPRGRPKGVQSEAETWRKVMSKKIPIQEKGRTRHVPVLEAILLRMTHEGLKGNFRSGQFLLKGHAAIAERGSIEPDATNEDDQAVLKAYLKQKAAEKDEDCT